MGLTVFTNLTPSAGSVLHAAEMFGISVAAVSGALAALRKRMDIFGLIVTAVVTSIGGGTVRDLLLDRHPIFWIAQPEYLLWGTAAALLTAVYARWLRVPTQALHIADAMTLAFFTISGAKHAFNDHLPAIIVVLMATMSGVAGGAIRDVLCGEVPKIFRGEVYATLAIAGASLFVLLLRWGISSSVAAGVAGTAIAVARCTAVLVGWRIQPLMLHASDQQQNV
jgi:uncharacterized membrane protein YeiH